MKRINVVIVEDDPNWQILLSSLIDKQNDMKIIGLANCKDEAVDIAHKNEIDIILMDISLFGNRLDGIYATAEISQFSRAKIIMLTSLDGESIITDSFTAGAVNYISKTQFKDIPEAIRSAYRSYSPYEVVLKDYKRLKEEEQVKELTVTEKDTFSLLEDGLTQPEIAKRMFISENTLKKHINKILKKLGVESSKDAVKKVKMRGLWYKGK